MLLKEEGVLIRLQEVAKLFINGRIHVAKSIKMNKNYVFFLRERIAKLMEPLTATTFITTIWNILKFRGLTLSILVIAWFYMFFNDRNMNFNDIDLFLLISIAIIVFFIPYVYEFYKFIESNRTRINNLKQINSTSLDIIVHCYVCGNRTFSFSDLTKFIENVPNFAWDSSNYVGVLISTNIIKVKRGGNNAVYEIHNSIFKRMHKLLPCKEDILTSYKIDFEHLNQTMENIHEAHFKSFSPEIIVELYKVIELVSEIEFKNLKFQKIIDELKEKMNFLSDELTINNHSAVRNKNMYSIFNPNEKYNNNKYKDIEEYKSAAYFCINKSKELSNFFDIEAIIKR